jgi:hypothetical protein
MSKWKLIARWSVLAILAISGIIAFVAGPGSKLVDRLPMEAAFVLIAVVGLSILLGLCELIYRVLDGPFPKLPAGVRPMNLYRRRVLRWMGIAAAMVLLLAVAARAGPSAWRENLFLAAWLAGLFSCVALWFFHYRARRYDFGRTALESNPWFHWVYTAAEMEAWEAGAGAETWIGAGLMFAGDYAPWSLLIYTLVRVEAPADPPSRLDFTFKKTSFGDATSLELIHVPIPRGRAADLEVIDRQLRAVCPSAQIRILS